MLLFKSWRYKRLNVNMFSILYQSYRFQNTFFLIFLTFVVFFQLLLNCIIDIGVIIKKKKITIRKQKRRRNTSLWILGDLCDKGKWMLWEVSSSTLTLCSCTKFSSGVNCTERTWNPALSQTAKDIYVRTILIFPAYTFISWTPVTIKLFQHVTEISPYE